MTQLANSPIQSKLANPGQPRPASQIDVQIEHLGKQVDELRCLAGDLESRLSPAIRERQDDACAAPNQAPPPEEYLVPHADRIRSIRKMAECLSTQFQSILSRLEV